MANTNYYVSETDLGYLFKKSGLPSEFQKLFVRDYVSLKRSVSLGSDEVGSIDSRVAANEASISSLTVSFAALSSSVSTLSSSYNAHAASTNTHGANGNIVGTGNYCTAVIGGTVLLASPIAAQTSAAVSITSTANAAAAAYSQTDAATWVTMLNEIKSDFNQLVSDYNSLVAKFNSALTSDVTAKQRAP